MAVPAVPVISGVSVEASNALKVTWGAVAGATSYKLYYSDDNSTYIECETESSITNSYYTYLDLAPDTLYYFKVTSVNADGESAKSAAASATTKTEDLQEVELGSTGPGIYDANAFNPDELNESGVRTQGNIDSKVAYINTTGGAKHSRLIISGGVLVVEYWDGSNWTEGNMGTVANESAEIDEKAADYTLTNSDGTILLNAASNDVTIDTMSSPDTGRIITIKRIDTSSHTAMIDATSTGHTTIDKNTTLTLSYLDAVRMQYDGTEWWII